MSDNEKNLIEDYRKEFEKERNYAFIKEIGNKILDNIKSTFRLKTSKKPISIKRYKSGWRGNGFVKTYKISSLAKGTLGAVINFGEPAYNLVKHGLNSKEFAGSLGSSIGSVLAAGAAGMAMGSFCPGIGNMSGCNWFNWW